MYFRPRYSLLVLFAVTVIVAVGVTMAIKIHQAGPQRIVERPDANHEIEYTLVVTEGGNREIHGPYVRRYRPSNSPKWKRILVTYFRAGEDTSMWHVITAPAPSAKQQPPRPGCDDPSLYEGILSEQELQEFHQALDNELQRIQDQRAT
jgi:hypothetical protein